MALYIQTDTSYLTTPGSATGVDAGQAFTDLWGIVNYNLGLKYNTPVLNKQLIEFTPSSGSTASPNLQTIYDLVTDLTSASHTPNYSGNIEVDAIIIPVLSDFVLGDGRLIKTVGGVAVAPVMSTLENYTISVTNHCVLIYDTTRNENHGYCAARAGTGVLDAYTSGPALLYNLLSRAYRILYGMQMAHSVTCNPASPADTAAINDENIFRAQYGHDPRDPTNACYATCPITPPPPPPPCCSCCIIASVASGSPQSEVVQELRMLRDGFLRSTEVGFAFFRSLFFDYYGFSPQVCTMMAADRRLPSLALRGFVMPLLIMLRTMRLLLQEGCSDRALGDVFLEQVGDGAQRAESLAEVRRASRFWYGEEMPAYAVAKDLSALLKERAWPSEHVQWAMVEPTRIYGEMLEVAESCADSEEIGRRIRCKVDRWASEIPLDHIWASLPTAKLAEELGLLESVLLQTPSSRARFRERLGDRFGTVPPIAKLLGTTALAGPAG